MQGVTVSSVGKSFALPKCSASKENKSRIRRTKEERRTMVVSFIKKYQNSNNGKFPSLNLTHKEVGGSFYTVREIVRDIIQENKVLGPGNPSSKLLNLEYHFEEEGDNGSSLDVHGSISISAFGDGIDHHEFASSMELLEVPTEENTAINKSANGSVLHEKLINNATKESNVHLLTAKKDDSWRSVEELFAEVQPNNAEDTGIQYAEQSLSLHPTASEAFLVESEQTNEGTHNNISVTSCHFESTTNITETSVTMSLPGTSMSFTEFVDDQSNCGARHDNQDILTLVNDTLDEDLSSKTVLLGVSNTSEFSGSADKGFSPSDDPFVKGTVIYSSELETLGLSREIASEIASNTSSVKGNVPFIPFDKEPFTGSAQSREIASSSEEGKSVGSFVLQTTSPAPEDTENDIQLLDTCNSFVDAARESENASSKLLEPVIQAADHSGVKFEKQSNAFSTVNGGELMSSSNKEATKDSEMLETNPLWAAIKAFVSSFIKFWSE